MIDHHNKVIFLHIPKTGGTAIEHYFATIRGIGKNDLSALGIFINNKKSTLERQNTHNSLSIIEKNIFGGSIPSDYKLFTVVRHPLDRLVSEMRSRRVPPPRWSPIHFRLPPWLITRLMTKPFYVLKDLDCHLRPQSAFLEGQALNRIRILRFESLSKDFANLQKSLHLPELPLPVLNASSGPMIKLSEKIAKRATEHYKVDFEMFDYPVNLDCYLRERASASPFVPKPIRQ